MLGGDKGLHGPPDNSTWIPDQQLLGFLHLLTEVFLEESKADSILSSLFDQFVLQLVRAFFTEWTELEDLHSNEMVINMLFLSCFTDGLDFFLFIS